MSAAAHDVPIPDSDSASDGLDFEDCEFIASGNAKPAVWSPGAEVLATADIEYVEPTWEGPEILRRGHSGRIVGLNADGNLLVDWDELETPKPARYDQVQGKEPGADAWGLRSLCGLWSNVLGHLWICPDPWNPEQCLYEEASLDGGFLQGTLKPLSSGGTSWWHGDVWAKFGEHETRWLHGDVWANVGEPEPGLHFASLPRFLVKPELSPEEDKWSHYEEQCQKQIRLQLLPARNQLKVQICGNCGNWNEIGEFERTLPKIGCPLQILRVEDVQKNSKDGQLDCGLGGCEASFCRERGFSLKIQLTIPVKGEVWYVATSQGAVMPPLSLETSSAWTILDCAPPGVELMLSGLHMNSKYDLNVALMRRSVLEYRGVSVQVVTSGKVKTFPDIRTQSKVWYFVRDDGLDEAYRAEDQITLETARSNYRASSSPECLKTVQCQQYTVDLRTMKQISSRQTERDVKRRAVSLVSDAPLADVCLWQLTSQYGQLVAARGTLPGIDASLANLDNAETIAKLLFQAESKVLLPNLPSLPGIFDDLTFAMVLFEKSQRLLRESLQQQSDDGVVAQAVDDRNSQRKHLCSVLKQSAQTIEDVKAFKATATAAMKAFDQSSILLTDLPDLPDLKSLPSVPSMIRSANIADTSREESGAAASHCGTGTSMPRRPSLGGLFGTDADATPGTGPSLGGLFGTGATSGASTSHCGAGPSLGGLFGTGATLGASAPRCGTGPSSGGLFGAGATPRTGPSLGGLFGTGATSGASASHCGTGPSSGGLFGAGATPGTGPSLGPSLGGLFGTGATPGTGPSLGPSLGGHFGTGATLFGPGPSAGGLSRTGATPGTGPSLGGLFGTGATSGASASHCGTGPFLGGLFGTGATSGASASHCGTGPSSGGLFGTGATPGTGPSLGGLFGTGSTSGASASHCGTGPPSGGLFGAGATPGTGPSLGPSLGGLFGAGATSGASASRCGTGPSLRGLFGAGATPGTGPSLGGLFGTGATPGTGPSLGGLFGTGSTSFGAYCGTGPSVGVAMFGTAATAGLFGADNPNAPALGTPLPGHAASRPTAATMPKDDALFHVEYTAPLCRKLSTCQAHLRKLRVEEVKGHRLSAATEEAKDRAVQSLQTVSRALEAGSTSVPPNCSGNTALSFAEAIQQEEHFRKVLSRRCKDFHKEVNDCCALARALLRKMIGAVEADLGTLAERVRLAEKHEALLSAPPKEEELHTLEDLYSYARDLHEDNLEKERRLEREQRTQQRRLSGHSEVGPAGSAALEEAKAATAVSRKNVQRAEQEFHRKLIDFVRIKQAPWGLPELRLKVDDEHLDTVDVLTPGRRCSDYEELLPLAGSSSTIFTAKYNEEACVLKELRSMTQSGALRREVLHRKKLKHPLIVPVLAAFEEEDKGRFIAYVHMPRYSCNLEEWCSSESCTLPKMCQVLRDLVLVVTYVHSHHVVHGDLKPSNFLMDSDDHPCLTDFETSQCLDAQSLHSRRTTLVVGASQGYMPPEFPNLTAASDIYSLGCICDHLLQCWAQKWPQNAAEQRKALSTVVAKMQRHETDDRPPAVEVLEDMTSAMKAETVEMSLPLYWRNSAELSYDKYEVLKEDLAEWNGLTTFQQLEHALLRTVHDSCLNRIFGNTLPRISFVQRVENPKLWRRYCLAKEQVTGAMFAPISPPVRPSCPMIDFSRNEYWLWHGTRQSNIDAILEEGLDEHLSRLEGLYGAGIYFSDEACKGLQYSDPGSCCLLFCRVVLGRPYYTKNTLPSMRSLKELKSRQGLLETPDVAGHHSVIVNPGPVQNHPNANGEQVHREFVIFDGAAVYPEYVVGINQ